MIRACNLLCLLIVVGLAGSLLPGKIGEGSINQSSNDPLQPLSFLKGSWHADGESPFGPFKSRTEVQRRGRWLLSTTDVFDPETEENIFTNTWVFGYDQDAEELILYVFDIAGVFLFRGEVEPNGVAFVWKDRDSWRRARFERREGGTVYSRYDAHVPAEQAEAGLPSDTPVTFEGIMVPSK